MNEQLVLKKVIEDISSRLNRELTKQELDVLVQSIYKVNKEKNPHF
ncbi:hypothetical protein PU629_00785 [Pullulanibacillus sp. KACC 23026]|nr:hypothetical protein [Pullulanibacillus sp. KACC 23026]WEG12923.1 hypothetical protein PU629_00785 [Pullulanibacillus sp. KACC 23026]